jgi:hypothetical protein
MKSIPRILVSAPETATENTTATGIPTPWEVVVVVRDVGDDQLKMSSTLVNATAMLPGRAATIVSRKTGTTATAMGIVIEIERLVGMLATVIAIDHGMIVVIGLDTEIKTATLECIGMFRACKMVCLGGSIRFKTLKWAGLLKSCVQC